MINNIKINNKNIGTAIFIVEGENGEINLLKHLLNTLLGYKLFIKRRNRKNVELLEGFKLDSIKDSIEYIEMKNKDNTIFIINSKSSNIKSISIEGQEFIDEIIEMIKFDYNLNIDNAYIYYIFDRDCNSNKKDLVEKLIKIYRSSTEPTNLEYDSNGGMLLLSYPSIESYRISNFEDNSFEILESKGKKLKEYIGEKDFQLNKICLKSLKKSLVEMFNGLNYINVINIESKNFYNSLVRDIDMLNEETFYKQEEIYNRTKKYINLSLLNLALIDLGILEYKL